MFPKQPLSTAPSRTAAPRPSCSLVTRPGGSRPISPNSRNCLGPSRMRTHLFTGGNPKSGQHIESKGKGPVWRRGAERDGTLPGRRNRGPRPPDVLTPQPGHRFRLFVLRRAPKGRAPLLSMGGALPGRGEERDNPPQGQRSGSVTCSAKYHRGQKRKALSRVTFK